MKKIAHVFFVVFFSGSSLMSGGAHISYPVLERIVANIERTHSRGDAALILLHTNARNMCGVRAIVRQNSDSTIGSGAVRGFGVHASMPIVVYSLDRVDVRDLFTIGPRLLHNMSPVASLLHPPCRIA